MATPVSFHPNRFERTVLGTLHGLQDTISFSTKTVKQAVTTSGDKVEIVAKKVPGAVKTLAAATAFGALALTTDGGQLLYHSMIALSPMLFDAKGVSIVFQEAAANSTGPLEALFVVGSAFGLGARFVLAGASGAIRGALSKERGVGGAGGALMSANPPS